MNVPADSAPDLQWRRDARMTPLYVMAWALSRVFGRVWFRSRIEHAGRVPVLGPVILASNHASFADPPLIGSSVPRAIHYLARDTLFDVPGFGWYIRRLNAVPVNRDGGGGAGLKAILDRLAAGGGIVLFPEGTRTPDGTLRPARSGIGLVAVKSGAPVVPVRIRGTYEAWGRHLRWPRPRPVSIVFGEPLRFDAPRAEAGRCDKARLKAIYQQVADEIMAAIRAL